MRKHNTNQQKSSVPNAIRDKLIIICSMHFADSRAVELKEIAMDRVLEWFPVSRKREDILVYLHDLVPCFLNPRRRTA